MGPIGSPMGFEKQPEPLLACPYEDRGCAAAALRQSIRAAMVLCGLCVLCGEAFGVSDSTRVA